MLPGGRLHSVRSRSSGLSLPDGSLGSSSRPTIRDVASAGPASAGAVNRGILTAACGENLGDEESMLERVEDESVVGNRCPACHGIALAKSSS
jgi:hypothetical protein